MTQSPPDNHRVITLRDAKTVDDEAANWLMILSRENVSGHTLGEFEAWLRQSVRHRRAFDRLSALWDDFGALTVLEDHAASVAEMSNLSKDKISRRVLMGVAASAGLAVLGGATFYTRWSAEQIQEGEFRTAVGEQKIVRLSDGSVVHLNTDTELLIAFTPSARNVALYRGEAHFEVAKDSRRKFGVRAGGGRIEAVGTAFTVRLRPSVGVEVTVEEGRVVLAPDAVDAEQNTALAKDAQHLSVGGNAIYNADIKKIAQLKQAEVTRKLSWRQGVLAYAGEPLSDVIADISRYTNVTIEVSDPSLRARPIGGYFKVDDVDELFESLELNFGLVVDRISDDHVQIRKAS